MNGKVKCKICKIAFKPDKRHPNQNICSKTTCRRKAQLVALRDWRKKYPDYFKNRADNIENMRTWRKSHPEYYKRYRKAHPELKKKTREYVRAHRARKRKENESKNKNEYSEISNQM